MGETSTEMSRDEWKMRIEEARRRIAAERRERRLGLRAPAEQDLAKIAAERALERALNDTTLEPGDIVSTGTPSGVGSVREPRVWLKDGDEVVVSSPTLGRLETTLRRP